MQKEKRTVHEGEGSMAKRDAGKSARYPRGSTGFQDGVGWNRPKTFRMITNEKRNIESERRIEKMVVASGDIGETKASEKLQFCYDKKGVEKRKERGSSPHMNRTNVMSKVDERKRPGERILKLENSQKTTNGAMENDGKLRRRSTWSRNVSRFSLTSREP